MIIICQNSRHRTIKINLKSFRFISTMAADADTIVFVAKKASRAKNYV